MHIKKLATNERPFLNDFYYRFMGMYSMIQFMAVILCYFVGSVLGNWQYLYQDLLVCVGCVWGVCMCMCVLWVCMWECVLQK